MVADFFFGRLPVIHFGVGAAEMTVPLLHKFGNSTLMVTGSSSFIEGESGKRLMHELASAGMDYDIVTVAGEPVTNKIDEITARMRKYPPASVLAVGGGSVLDAGKAISAMIPVDGVVWDYLEGNPAMRPHPGSKVPFIAVPTTAGTGSEATKNAVLSTTGTPVMKRSLRHDNFVPDAAIVDPSLTLTCPPDVTAASGLDAITQLLEAYLSVQASPVTDALALSGLQRGFAGIRRVFESGYDIDARTDMSYAALMSGIVLAGAGLGAVHGFASVLGPLYDIPHGVICGTLLGAVTRTNINKLKESGSGNRYLEKYVTAGKLICEGKDMGDDHYLSCLTESIDCLIEDMEMPKLERFGVDNAGCALVAGKTGIKNNPVGLDRDELEKILLSRL
ncbi:MAG: iron-containing alcohol dehydrogenase [Bacteroidales bacterium]